MNTIPPNQLLKRLEKALRAVDGIGSLRYKSYKDPDEYRLVIKKALQDLKDMTLAIMESGHLEAIKAVGEIGKEVSRECEHYRELEYNEVFWDELSNFYPQTNTYRWRGKGFSQATELKLFTQALEHSSTPSSMVRGDMNCYQGEQFLDVLLVTVERLTMPYRKIDLILGQAFDFFKQRLNDRDFQQQAVDHILAHQDVYFPVIEKLVGLCNLAASYDRESSDRAHHREIRESLIPLLDYSPDEYTHNLEMPEKSEMRSLRESLSWPAEFLAALFLLNPHNPVIKAQAELAFDCPVGPTPYQHFESMGIARSPEWHAKSQEDGPYAQQIPLYEYAIYKPGVEVSVNWIKNTNINLSSQRLDEYLRLLEGVKTKDPEARRKSQVLFDALVQRASERHNDWMIKKIKDSALDPRYFAKHPKLRGELLETRLGL
jgi:hypothetical protein